MGIEHMRSEQAIKPIADEREAARPRSLLENMLRKWVPRFGLLTTAILPSIAIAVVAAVVVWISEYGHEPYERLVINCTIAGVAVFLVSAGLIVTSSGFKPPPSGGKRL
jgi:hypothetical protein